MPADTQRFAQVVLAAFSAAGRSTDREVSRAGGPSTTTMTKLRAAKSGKPLAEPRSQTWAAIERAAGWPPGSARAVWDGGEPPEQTVQPDTARPIGDPSDDLVEFEIAGNFGVRAVVRGPIRDMEALQAAAAQLVAGMQVDESNTRSVP